MRLVYGESSLDLAERYLLAQDDLTWQSLKDALNLIGSRCVDDADIFLQYSCAENWGVDEGSIKTGGFSISQGVGVRAVSGEKTAFAYSDSLSKLAVMNAAKTVRIMARTAQTPSKPIGIKAGCTQKGRLYGEANPLLSLNSLQKAALLEQVDRKARAVDPRIVQVMASLSSEWEIVLIARLDGAVVADVRPLVHCSLTVIAEQNGRREVGSAGGGARSGLEYFSEDQLDTYVARATRAALTNLEARSAPAGEMTVVLGPGWPGILLHEAVGHGLEGDFNRKGASVFAGRIGERVAARGVTVWDDGTISGRRGSLNVDDEGNPTQATLLIENGVLKGYMQDAQNARLMKQALTGNGRRQSYAHLPMPRMTNTYMANGDCAPEEVISSIKKGLYAVNFAGGQVDVTSGNFVFSTSEAFWVENGKILYPIKGATLIGNGPQVLQRISMIGNDMRLDAGVGTCGKQGQSVPVGVGQPTLRIEQMTVGGTA